MITSKDVRKFSNAFITSKHGVFGKSISKRKIGIYHVVLHWRALRVAIELNSS